jgi:hypothetical protein
MNAPTEKKAPTHRAYFVQQPRNEGDKAEWIELGAAWPHSDGKGLDVVLKVLPVGGFAGRLTLRAIEPKE